MDHLLQPVEALLDGRIFVKSIGRSRMAWQCYRMRSLWMEGIGRWRQGSNGRQRRRGWERSNRRARKVLTRSRFEFRAGINGYWNSRRKYWFRSHCVARLGLARFGLLDLAYFRLW